MAPVRELRAQQPQLTVCFVRVHCPWGGEWIIVSWTQHCCGSSTFLALLTGPSCAAVCAGMGTFVCAWDLLRFAVERCISWKIPSWQACSYVRQRWELLGSYGEEGRGQKDPGLAQDELLGFIWSPGGTTSSGEVRGLTGLWPYKQFIDHQLRLVLIVCLAPWSERTVRETSSSSMAGALELLGADR